MADLMTIDDDSNNISLETDQGSILTKTTWTLLLYLTSESDGCRGGETVFFPNDRRVAKEEVAVSPETGMVLLHKHGNDCMLVSHHPLFHLYICITNVSCPGMGTNKQILSDKMSS